LITWTSRWHIKKVPQHSCSRGKPHKPTGLDGLRPSGQNNLAQDGHIPYCPGTHSQLTSKVNELQPMQRALEAPRKRLEQLQSNVKISFHNRQDSSDEISHQIIYDSCTYVYESTDPCFPTKLRVSKKSTKVF